VVDTWNFGKIDIFREIEKEPLTKNGCTCFKTFTVLHKLLQEGAPRVSPYIFSIEHKKVGKLISIQFLKRAHGAITFIRQLQNYWAATASSDPRMKNRPFLSLIHSNN
jgi:hypothetical protein